LISLAAELSGVVREDDVPSHWRLIVIVFGRIFVDCSAMSILQMPGADSGVAFVRFYLRSPEGTYWTLRVEKETLAGGKKYSTNEATHTHAADLKKKKKKKKKNLLQRLIAIGAICCFAWRFAVCGWCNDDASIADICKQVARTLGVSRGTFKMSTLLEYKGEQIGTIDR
jgi:hypothetical protein